MYKRVSYLISTINTTTFFFFLAIVIGIILRSYNLTEQILLDDEWHSLDYVPGKSLYYLFTHIGISANSIPMNIYSAILLSTLGWSELLLRLPSFVFGVISLVVLPLFVKKLIGSRAFIFFCFFMAISPILIYYSRVSRGYSAVSFLVFFSLISLYLWLVSGQSRYALFYILSGALSVYFHLFALVGVVSPFGIIFLYRFCKPGQIGKKEIIFFPKFRHILLVLFGLLMLLSIMLLPALLQSRFPMVPTEDRASLYSFAGVIPLICGTADPFLIILLMSMVIWGYILLLKQRPLLSCIFFIVILFYFISIKSVKHSGIHNPLEIARFSICIFPISYMFASIGIDRFLSLFQVSNIFKCGNILIASFTGLFWVVLFIKGPLPELYGPTNNFTNHSAFQESYKQKDRERSYENPIYSEYYINRKDIPSFYFMIASQEDVKKIIEYPMYIGNHFNFFYFYQQYHKKKIIIGYITNIEVLYPSEGCIYGNFYPDIVLSRIKNLQKLKFSNMVNMFDVDSIKESGVSYAILHKNLLHEMSSYPHETEEYSFNSPDLFQNDVYIPVMHLSQIFRLYFGEPILENQSLVVFKIK